MNLLPLILFAAVASITPGPNNFMLWASGMNFGLRRTLPHLLGINIGFGSLVLAVGLGLGVIFEAFPVVEQILKWVGSAYLLYLAYRIATATGLAERSDIPKPFTFLEAAAFQYVNPKAWIMAITAIGAFRPEDLPSVLGILSVAGVFMIVNVPCVLAWAGAGVWMGRVLQKQSSRRIANAVLGLLLVGTVVLLGL